MSEKAKCEKDLFDIHFQDSKVKVFPPKKKKQ